MKKENGEVKIEENIEFLSNLSGRAKSAIDTIVRGGKITTMEDLTLSCIHRTLYRYRGVGRHTFQEIKEMLIEQGYIITDMWVNEKDLMNLCDILLNKINEDRRILHRMHWIRYKNRVLPIGTVINTMKEFIAKSKMGSTVIPYDILC